MQLQLLWRVMGTGAILYTHIVGDHQVAVAAYSLTSFQYT